MEGCKIKAVILAAGEGTRLRPFTYTRPKAMIPVAGKPILEWIIESLRNAGLTEIIIVVHYMKEKIIEYFGDGSNFNVKITYVEQPEAKGTGDALLQVEKFIKGHDFLLMYGDLLTPYENIVKLLDEYHKREHDAVIAGVRVDDVSNYAAIITSSDGIMIKKIIEKPPKNSVNSDIANAGIYVFSVDIFGYLKNIFLSKRGELELPDAIQKSIDDGKKVSLVTLNKWWLDVGRPWDILVANELILKSLPHRISGYVEQGATIKGPVIIEKGAVVRSGAYIVGPAYIAEGADIGPNSFIRPYTTIGKYSRVGNACEIKNSVLFENVHIAHLSYVGDSVIGANVNFGAGTITANLRLDDKAIKMNIKGKRVNTGRRKLGAFVGDNVKTGIGAMLMPGVTIGNDSAIGPGLILYSDVPPHTLLLKRESLEKRKWLSE